MTHFHLQPQNRALFDHWRSLRRDSQIPPRSAFDPAKVKDLLGALFMLDPTAPHFTVRLWGQDLAELFGQDLTDQPFLILTGHEEYLPGRRDILFRAAFDHKPVAAYSTLCWENKTLLAAEEIYLPLAPDDHYAGRILGSLRLIEPDKISLTRERRFAGWRPEVLAELEPKRPGQSSASAAKSLSSWSSVK